MYAHLRSGCIDLLFRGSLAPTAHYSRNEMSDGCSDESGSSERNCEKREKGETTKIEILVEPDVIRGNKNRCEDKDVGE